MAVHHEVEARMEIPRERIEAFCRRWHIVELALFGSILRDDFGPESDVDVLATFDPDHPPSLFEHVDMQDELAEMLGRPVDLVNRKGLERSENPFWKKSILGSARVNPDHAYLADVLIAARRAQRFVADVGWTEFESDEMRESAVVRQLEIMGEATKHLSSEFRASHPDTPWREIAGMRDVLIHSYRRVDPAEVWRIATRSVPPLIAALEPLVRAAEAQLEDPPE